MPISKENKARYPKNWKEIRSKILARAASCEWCNAKNYLPHPVTGSKVILTIAHIFDHSPENCDPNNLAALCQKCHNGHDAKTRSKNRKSRRDKGKKRGARNVCSGYGWCEVHGEHGP
jgi:5-methylcytosine-specific restriction endonuclease McrA